MVVVFCGRKMCMYVNKIYIDNYMYMHICYVCTC